MLFWALLVLLINCYYHLLHLNVMCFEQNKLDLIWFDLIRPPVSSQSDHRNVNPPDRATVTQRLPFIWIMDGRRHSRNGAFSGGGGGSAVTTWTIICTNASCSCRHARRQIEGSTPTTFSIDLRSFVHVVSCLCSVYSAHVDIGGMPSPSLST